LNWTVLAGSRRSGGVFVFRPPAVDNYVGNVYRFAISVERTIAESNVLVSSGLVWTDCVYNVNKSKSVLMYALHTMLLVMTDANCYENVPPEDAEE